jgi:hypothetical protein
MELVVVGGIVVAVGLSAWLFMHAVLGVCNCYCGPGECQCACACRKDCPCFFRDRFQHNENQHGDYAEKHWKS